MKTKAIMLISFLILGASLSGCGNKSFIDTTYTFNFAQFTLPDGQVISGRLLKWKDYDDGEQLQLTMDDGNTYLVSSYNAILTTKALQGE